MGCVHGGPRPLPWHSGLAGRNHKPGNANILNCRRIRPKKYLVVVSLSDKNYVIPKKKNGNVTIFFKYLNTVNFHQKLINWNTEVKVEPNLFQTAMKMQYTCRWVSGLSYTLLTMWYLNNGFKVGENHVNYK